MKNAIKKLTTAVVIGIPVAILYNSFHRVKPGFSAIVFNKFTGVGEKVFGEGFFMTVPFMEFPIFFDILPHKEVGRLLAKTKDGKIVEVDFEALCRPVTEELPKLFLTIGPDYGKMVIPSLGNEIIKAVFLKYNSSQIESRKGEIVTDIKQKFMENARKYSIIIEDVALTDLKFS